MRWFRLSDLRDDEGDGGIESNNDGGEGDDHTETAPVRSKLMGATTMRKRYRSPLPRVPCICSSPPSERRQLRRTRDATKRRRRQRRVPARGKGGGVRGVPVVPPPAGREGREGHRVDRWGGGGRRRRKQRRGRRRGSGVARAGGGRQRVEGTERGKQPLQPSEVAVRPERERLGQEPQRGDEAVPRPEGEGAARGATAEAAGRSSATRGTTPRRCACAATCP